MQPQDKDQILLIIHNLDQTKKYVPYFSDLVEHPHYGAIFRGLDSEEIIQVQNCINEYITQQLQGYKTKWGEMFRRFFALHQDLFREFRRLNGEPNAEDTENFQTLGKTVESELYKFENMLTQTMIKKPQGLDKTLAAFYDIAYRFFPKYNLIG
jgi:hypothetical protein